MTLSIGLDVVHVPDFREQLADPASAFVDRTFTVAERAGAPAAEPRRSQYLAVRYAAKEAVIKAWSGAKFGQRPALRHLDLAEIEVVADAWGRPSIQVHGEVARAMGAIHIVSISLSHDGPTAAAVVLAQAGS